MEISHRNCLENITDKSPHIKSYQDASKHEMELQIWKIHAQKNTNDAGAATHCTIFAERLPPPKVSNAPCQKNAKKVRRPPHPPHPISKMHRLSSPSHVWKTRSTPHIKNNEWRAGTISLLPHCKNVFLADMLPLFVLFWNTGTHKSANSATTSTPTPSHDDQMHRVHPLSAYCKT